MAKPIPQSTVDRARRLADVHELQVVALILDLHPSQITRMKQRGWKAADYATLRRKRPNDFAIQARHMNHAELMRHYRAGSPNIARWMKETRARPSWRGRRVRPAPAEPAPSPALCHLCSRAPEGLGTACPRSDCPLRPRHK